MSEAKYWALVPAGGVGSRMGADRPKQYLELMGRTVLEHTLERLCGHPRIEAVQVCVSPEDAYWPRLRPARDKLLEPADGGAERANSVLNGLRRLAGRADLEDWVLVHDAVRPCVRHVDMDALINGVLPGDSGALLAVPVADTVKRTDQVRVVRETVSRDCLWRALTPQMFRIGELTGALERALDAGMAVTDEASAMEYAGARVRVVAGHGDNIKITLPGDLALAELFLARQAKAAS